MEFRYLWGGWGGEVQVLNWYAAYVGRCEAINRPQILLGRLMPLSWLEQSTSPSLSPPF
jgi:hypothetical protein